MTGHRSDDAKQANRKLLERSQQIERDREQQTKRVKCPVCPAESGETCEPIVANRLYSHTGRYRLAAQVGLVPPLPTELPLI